MSKSVVVGVPGLVLKAQDIARVARGALVELDQNAATRIKKESPSPSAFKPEESPANGGQDRGGSREHLNTEESRAAVFLLLLTLVNGKSKIRLWVVERLVDLLNKPGLELRVGASGGSDFGDLVHLITQSEDGESSAISADERVALTPAHVPTAALGALAVVAAKQLQRTCLAITALACEALQADVRDLDADKAESVCSSEAAGMATDLRDMLNDSGRLNARKGGAGAVACILQVPAILGELEGAAARCESLVQAAAAASPADPALPARLAPTIGLPACLLQLATLLTRTAELSLQRIQLVGATLKDGLSALWLKNTQYNIETAQDAWRSAQNTATGFNDPACVSVAQAASRAVVCLWGVLGLESAALIQSLKDQGLADRAPPPADSKAASKAKKKGKDAAGTLGVGTTKFRSYLEGSRQSTRQEPAAALGELSLDDETRVTSNPKFLSVLAMEEALDPLSEGLGREVEALQQLVQASAKLRKPKVAKGARDFMPEQMAIRKAAFSAITTVFQLHGGVAIDTPVFELKETLTGKYGEDSKLIYDLKDQGGELLSLRYDLTVPFARYVALYGITSIKRYHIAKVYRRDQPQMARGRYREFYQCDFDVAGNSPLMVADAEVLKVLTEILVKLDLGRFSVKINHRVLLDGMMQLCGVPADKFRTICSAIDKLDKEPWEAVRAEMVDEKGLAPQAADKIGTFVGDKGEPKKLLEKLLAPGHDFAQDAQCKAALMELQVLFDLLDMMGALSHFSFDLSLARGLDYYTGVIYEAVMEGANVGSIAAGGRYDNLVGMFSGKQVPAVGVSLGIERIFSLLEQKYRSRAEASNGRIRETKTQVLVMSASKDMQGERIRLAGEFWQAGISAEFTYKANPFMPEQMSHATASGIPVCVVLRPTELQQGTVELMETVSGAKEEVPRAAVVGIVAARLRELGPLDLVVPGRLAE